VKSRTRAILARARRTRSAAAAIADALVHHGLAEDIRAERVVAEWSELVGPRVAARTRPFGIVGRLLVVDVATSAWLHELSLLRPRLVADLHERLGEPRLFDDLKLRLAGNGREGPAPRPPRRSVQPAPRPPIAPASGAARERIVREVTRVDDAELRELIARVRIENDR
jgi:hypothetical protein